MSQKSAILNFPKSQIDRPVISHIVKNFDVEVNILKASITPEEDGRMFVIFEGKQKSINKALGYLEESKVQVILPTQNLIWNEDRCVACTACVGQCSSNAFTVDPKTFRVEYNSERCIACELCIPACFYKAVESVGNHLKRTGELS
ncbi:MAG: 4Fe-4S dicluster domain-containing protein [Proteobacteria bacterium]|nr:4Fe-4S dicluster domain-containing protein [Pseudomonadota bacterium]